MILEDVLKLVFGGTPLTAGSIMDGHGQLPHRLVDSTRPTTWSSSAIGLLAAVGLWWFIYRTRFGVILRATSQDRRMASALGLNVGRVYVQAFAIGCFMAGLGGAVVVPAQAAVLGMGSRCAHPGLRGRRHRRPRQPGRRPRRRSDRQRRADGGRTVLPRDRACRSLPDRGRGAADTPDWAVREGVSHAGQTDGSVASPAARRRRDRRRGARGAAEVRRPLPDRAADLQHGLRHRRARLQSAARLHGPAVVRAFRLLRRRRLYRRIHRPRPARAVDGAVHPRRAPEHAGGRGAVRLRLRAPHAHLLRYPDARPLPGALEPGLQVLLGDGRHRRHPRAAQRTSRCWQA